MSSKDKRKLAAIMFADVVGYSRMMANNEERTLELLKDFENICSPIISDNEGKIIKKVGDELFCEFSSAKQAVDCALNIQNAIQPYNDSRPKDFKLQVRIGIHVGDIVLRDGDVFGDGVNVASRIQPFSNPGGICISNAVKESISSHPNYNIISEGQQELKNIIEKHTLYRVETGYEIVDKDRKIDKPKEEKKNKWIRRFLMFIGFIVIMNLLMWFVNWNFKNNIIDKQLTIETSIGINNPNFERITFLGNVRNYSISPDGNFFVYNTLADSKYSLFVQDINSLNNPINILTLEPNDIIRTVWWSKNGEKIKLSVSVSGPGNNQTYIIPKLGGSIQKTPFHQTSSPDGKLGIEWFMPTHEFIEIIELETGEIIDEIKIDDNYLWFWDIKWSPINNVLLYITLTDGKYTFKTISKDIKRENILFTENVIISNPVWSPKGDAFYYLKMNKEKSDLMKVKVNQKTGVIEGEPRTFIRNISLQLPYHPEYNHLSISETGKLLIRLGGDDSFSNIVSGKTISIGDSTFLQTKYLTNGTNQILALDISPDEKRIALTMKYSTNSNIFIMPITGGKKTQVTFFDSSYCMVPVWSPNGEEIAFINSDNNKLALWKVDINNGELHKFKGDSLSGDVHYLTWNNENKIIYQKEGNRNFHVLDVSTEERTELLKDDSVGWGVVPSFSPDMNHVSLFWNRPRDGRGVWVIPIKNGILDEKNARRLIARNCYSSEWSKNNKLLYAYCGEKIITVQVTDGSIIDSIHVSPLANFKQMTSDEKTFIFIMNSEATTDLWYINNIE